VEQTEIRKRLNEYIFEEGVRAKHIAKKINIHEPIISKFRQNKMDIRQEQLKLIEEFLNTKQV